jgi:hypothetical protein
MLVGDVLLVTLPEIRDMALLYGAIGLFHVIFRRKFLVISLNPADAVATRMNVGLWDILFYMSFGVVITKSVAIVGVLLVFSYLVVPAVLAQLWADTIKGRLLLGWLVAIVASTLGIAWSFYLDYPTGPAIVVMLGVLLILSGIIYYIKNAPARMRAMVNVAAMALFGVAFAAGLVYFKKTAPAVASAAKAGPVDLLLKDLESDEEAHQLGSLEHLGDIRDPRIVPALNSLLSQSKSDRVIEAVIAALSKQQDPRALPALRSAAKRDLDAFLKLNIAQTQVGLGDPEGYATLISVLKSEAAAYARLQANDLLEKKSGRHFGYNADLPAAQNSGALRRMEEWYDSEGARSTPDAKTAPRK